MRTLITLILFSITLSAFGAGTANERFAKKYMASIGASNITIEMDEVEILTQKHRFGGGVDFKTALHEAMESFLRDYSDIESPMALIMDELTCEEVGFGPGCDEWSEETIERKADVARETLRELLNRPDTELSILKTTEEPEGEEKVSENWIFHLSIDSYSDHSHWAVVHRNGANPTYNYGFN